MSQEEIIDQLFKEAIAAIRAGDKATGREKLMKVIELNEFHEHAWMWLGGTVETDEERIICLENALTINPNNEKARKVLERLRGKPAASPTIPPAPGSTSASASPAEPEPEVELEAPPAAAAGEDSWRTSLYTEPANEGTVTGGKSRRREALGEESEYGLGDAWFGALIFRVAGAYETVVERAEIGHTLINLALVGVLTAIIGILSIQLILAPSGGVYNLIMDYSAQAGVPMTASDLEALREFDRMMGTVGMLGIGVVIFFFMAIGILINTGVYHIGAKVLGGKGDFMQTFSGVSLAYVAYTILLLIPTVLAIVTLFITGQLHTALAVMNFGSSVLSLYLIALNVTALMTAHEFNFFRGFASLILGPVVLGIFCCCLSFGLNVLAGTGTAGY